METATVTVPSVEEEAESTSEATSTWLTRPLMALPEVEAIVSGHATKAFQKHRKRAGDQARPPLASTTPLEVRVADVGFCELATAQVVLRDEELERKIIDDVAAACTASCKPNVE